MSEGEPMFVARRIDRAAVMRYLTEPQTWYLQQWEDLPPFWDSYLHTHSGCRLIRTEVRPPLVGGDE